MVNLFIKKKEKSNNPLSSFDCWTFSDCQNLQSQWLLRNANCWLNGESNLEMQPEGIITGCGRGLGTRTEAFISMPPESPRRTPARATWVEARVEWSGRWCPQLEPGSVPWRREVGRRQRWSLATMGPQRRWSLAAAAMPYQISKSTDAWRNLMPVISWTSGHTGSERQACKVTMISLLSRYCCWYE